MCRCESIDLVRRSGQLAAMASPPAPALVRLRFAGSTARLVRGSASGVGYAVFPGDLVFVDPADVHRLVAAEDFARVAQ
jgi:hypothetical protein